MHGKPPLLPRTGVLLLLSLALFSAGAQTRCAGAQSVGLCGGIYSRGLLQVENRHTGDVRLVITNTATGVEASNTVVHTSYTPDPMDEGTETDTVFTNILLPSGDYSAVATNVSDGASRGVLPPTFSITCGATQNFVIEGSVMPRLPVDIGGHGILRPEVLPEVSECVSRPADPIEKLFLYDAIRNTTLGATIEANKLYIERFFETHFPEFYAETGGQVFDVEITTEPGTTFDIEGTHTVMVVDVKYTVRPEYRFLNNGQAAGGQYAVSKQWYVEGGEAKRVIQFVANPVERRGSSAFVSYEYHQPWETLEDVAGEDPASDHYFDTTTFIHYQNTYATGLEFQMGFIPSRCYDSSERLMTPFFRDRPAAFGIDLPFSDWTKSYPLLSNCILKELNKPLRGNLDFIRRKLMDLSGNDELIFSWLDEEHGAFEIGYNGTYACGNTILFELLSRSGD